MGLYARVTCSEQRPASLSRNSGKPCLEATAEIETHSQNDGFHPGRRRDASSRAYDSYPCAITAKVTTVSWPRFLLWYIRSPQERIRRQDRSAAQLESGKPWPSALANAAKRGGMRVQLWSNHPSPGMMISMVSGSTSGLVSRKNVTSSGQAIRMATKTS